MSRATSFGEELDRLAVQGLNWAAYVPASHSPQPLELRRDQGLLLLLSLGSVFGEQTGYRSGDEANPLDERARTLTEAFIVRALKRADEGSQLMYPHSACRLDLRAWLLAARVHYPSRLGTGIRPDCGTWFAVRAAVGTALPAAERRVLLTRYPPLPDAPSPCDTCVDAPCVSACPARAIDASDHLKRCVDYRLSEQTSCGDRCHSRLSCPVGRQHAYPESLLRYHYGVSLRMLRRWKAL